MRIIIEELLKDENYYEKLNPVGKKIFDFKLGFVHQRLSVLQDEMLKEEIENPSAVIKLVMDGETVNDFTFIKGYSATLLNKIKGCLIGQGKYFQDEIYKIVNSHFN